MATYRVKTPLHHDGKSYEPGKTVKIDDDAQAKALLDVDTIEPLKDEKKDPSK